MWWKMWVCAECDFEIEQTRVHFGTLDAQALQYSGTSPMCPNCSLVLKEETQIEGEAGVNVFGINNAPYRRPLHSDALGVQPDQVAEHRELFPNVELDSENRPVFTNTNQHDAYMEKAGIRKDVQKTRRRGEVIAKLGDEDADRTDAPDVQEEDSEETEDAGRVQEDGLGRLVVADV